MGPIGNRDFAMPESESCQVAIVFAKRDWCNGCRNEGHKSNSKDCRFAITANSVVYLSDLTKSIELDNIEMQDVFLSL
jgi:hypothetical protein